MLAELQVRQRCGTGQRVCRGRDIPDGIDETVCRRVGRHLSRERDQQEAAGAECRVHEVLAQAAVQLFDDDDGKDGADDRDPPGDLGRHVHAEQQTGHNGAQVTGRDRLVHQFFIAVFRRHCRCRCDHQDQQGMQAEIKHTKDTCRKQCNEHVEHDLLCRDAVSYVR